jgi:hypothetical protein
VAAPLEAEQPVRAGDEALEAGTSSRRRTTALEATWSVIACPETTSITSPSSRH